jgi:hypothetical protein
MMQGTNPGARGRARQSGQNRSRMIDAKASIKEPYEIH